MSKQWIPLQRTAQLEEIRQASFDKPVVIFKHSTTCSISQMALGRWERSWQAQPGTPLEAYFLDLRQFRDVSNAVDFFLNPQSDFVTGQVIYLGGA